MKWLQKIDHVTYVVRPDTIRKWAWLYIEKFGGKITLRVDDTNPREKSSMMLWCIDFGEFGIALVAGIDRQEKSHVTAYAEKHGDHSVQHVAFQVPDLAAFQKQMVEQCGLHLLGPILQRNDGFGWVRQVFAKGYNDTPTRPRSGSPSSWNDPSKKAKHSQRFPSPPMPEPVFTSRRKRPWTPISARPWSISAECPTGWEPVTEPRP